MANEHSGLKPESNGLSYAVDVAGHHLPLRVFPQPTECGPITDGVAFEFAQQGTWVIALDTLRAIVAVAEEARA